MSDLEVLVELQELDTRLSQLDHKSETLPDFDHLAELEAGDRDSKVVLPKSKSDCLFFGIIKLKEKLRSNNLKTR